MAMKGTKHTYATGKGRMVAGAEVSMGFRPQGTRPGSMVVSAMIVGGGMATFDGPFDWRIDAIGDNGVHESLVVHRIRTRTAVTKREEWFPEKELGRVAVFRKLEDQEGKVRARYPIPGQLRVEPEKDGRLDVWVDLTVRTRSGPRRETVHFALDPAVKSADEFMFLPTEIVESIGRDPADWEDPMWE